MYTMQNILPIHHHNSSRVHKIPWLKLAAVAIIVCILLSLITLNWYSHVPPRISNLSTNTTPPLFRRINVPYFNSDVPFNQTAIFWFGKVEPTSDYIDVRMGYNNSELYVDLHIVDQFLWYDPNWKAPDVTRGDTATLYLSTENNGSNAPDLHSYKFVAQVSHTEPRTYYQKVYQGNGSSWVVSNISFTAVSGWRGKGFNGQVASGWTMTYHIPFASLGFSGPPVQGTPWMLGVKVQNQDDAQDTPIPDTWWPETASDLIPSSWGDLVFGLPTYQPPQTLNNTTYMVRNQLNNQVVTDGMVGGALGCGNQGLNRWTQVGDKTYPGATQVAIENEWDVSDWNCHSKFYITFPLSSLPTGKGVIAATVTLYLYSNAGIPGKPNPSFIQVATVNEDWNPQTLSWNSAPLVKENISSIVVNTRSGKLQWPGVPYTWDVSKAVADAYASGQPLRLVFYSSDSAYKTSKYFSSSTVGNWNANGRPTIQATLGDLGSFAPPVPR